MTVEKAFKEQMARNIAALGADQRLKNLSCGWIKDSGQHGYAYNFSWLGRPIIQLPQDIVALQELIWGLQPNLIIEAGIAHGGSLILSASMLELNAACGGPTNAKVLGIDVDIRQHNREAIEAHPLIKRISMIEGSSIAPDVIERVVAQAEGQRCVMVILDSNHTHDHVLAELEAYAPLTTVGSYCVVFDTVIEDLPADLFLDRPWGPGNNPKTAVRAYLESNPDFEVDNSVEDKLLITAAPGGYLRRASSSTSTAKNRKGSQRKTSD